MTITTAQIIKMIGCDKLELCKGDGYWYFIYDDLLETGLYGDKAIPVNNLNHMSIDQWVAEGQELIDEIKNSSYNLVK